MDLEQIKRAIAWVVASDGVSRTGTAFYIGNGYALTALHVVADTRSRNPLFAKSVRLTFHEAGLDETPVETIDCWDVDDDWALLKCVPPPGVAPIECGAAPRVGEEWESFGYPTIQKAGLRVVGEIRDPNAALEFKDGKISAQRAIQLHCEDATGTGPPLHGLSGAPCLVGGKAVGILRKALTGEIDLGEQSRPLVFTQGGICYATSAHKVVAWQLDRRLAVLGASWGPPDLVMQDFLVLLSEREKKTARVKLRSVVRDAQTSVADKGLREPYFLTAADAVSSQEMLEQCTRALCRAQVVVFDATGFEPAIMFLAGIRAVAKRGVTLLSVGGNYALGKQLDIPFNVKDANIVAHSREQDRSPMADSVTLLTERIRRGLDEMRSPHYLDLPVYDAIRALPADRRGLIPSEEGVLALCPFDKGYEKVWNETLKLALGNQLARLRAQARKGGIVPSLGVARSFELNSPRLVTKAVYEAIRRVQSCVVDLTGWGANVLFELGVRLASSPEHTACIIDVHWEEKMSDPLIKPQCRDLAVLLGLASSTYDPLEEFQDKPVFKSAYGPDAVAPASGLLSGALHKLVESALEVDSEPASRPVYEELQDQAALFSRPPGAAGKMKPVGLFPGNAELVRREEEADRERLLAAWFYISNRYTTAEILERDALREACDRIVQVLFARHAAEIRKIDKLWTDLNTMDDELDKRRRS